MSPPIRLNTIIHRQGRVHALQTGHLFDAYLYPIALDTIASRYFTRPATLSWSLMNLIHQAVASGWPHRYPTLWHTILTSCRLAKLRHNKVRVYFSVRINGLSTNPYWLLQATTKRDEVGTPYLFITLADKRCRPLPFTLGHTVMTQGAAALNINFFPFLTQHLQRASGLDNRLYRFPDKTAVSPYRRFRSTHIIQTQSATTPIWIITKATRTATAILLPDEY